MAYAVEMYFDSASDKFVRETWQKLDDAGLGHSMLAAGFRPHVSLGVCNQLARPGLHSKALDSFFKVAPPISFNLSSTGIFHSTEGVIFYGATVTRQLLEVHAAFDSIFLTYAQRPWEYYRPDLWTPHCTLAIKLKPTDVSQAVHIALQARLPLPVQVPEIGIIDVTPVSSEVLELIKLDI